ncbi:MAG: endopeptidase La [Elusimicrobiota bacterium]
MNNDKKKIMIPEILPLLPIRDVIIFPHMMMPLAVGREKSIKALEKAMDGNRLIFVATQKKLQTENPSKEDLFEVGCIVEILQLLRIPDGTIKILVEGISRAKIIDYFERVGYVDVEIAELKKPVVVTHEIEALMRNVQYLFEEYIKLNRRLPLDLTLNLANIDDPEKLADIIAAHILIKVKDKQLLLAVIDPVERLNKLSSIIASENEILMLEKKIQGRVRGQIEKSQKEYYLTEQMKAIKKELKHKDEYSTEMDELAGAIKAANMTKEAEEAAIKEHERLTKMMPFSPEATVIRTYLDWLITLPWDKKTNDRLDVKTAEKILEEDHYGLQKAKERILEYLAVRKLTKKMKGPILCFVGPPGVGKTSLGRSIARAMGRTFIRISLGGVRDEAEIRGHRRTYIGALPGRIIQSLRKAKFKNPVFLLDEIDKLGMDFRGDPASALLEVLDPEQNSTFADHYLEVEFDLSDVLFITTANTFYNIPPALFDRMELIRFPGYTTHEKVKIAQKYLVPKQKKENGLDKANIDFNDESIKAIIKGYTREAGVRNLEREIANICRKIAKNIVAEKLKISKKINVDPKNIDLYLGAPKFFSDLHAENEIGVATGLAWTEVGGDILNIEVSIMPGKGVLSLTGKLGDVMKESAQAGLSYIRSNAKKLGIKEGFFNDKEIHVHVPEGAIPKDGPSAGITMTVAMISALTGRKVKKDLAMTGEMTLRGRVLPIGGLKEKVLAAHRGGIKTILFPVDNIKDIEEIPKEIQKKINLITVKHITEVIDKALAKR